MRLFTRPVTITRTVSTGVDAMGRPTKATTTTTVNCAYRQRFSSDTFDGGLVASDDVTFYFPPATQVAAADLITLGSDTYEVVSEPFGVWNHRTASLHHLEVRGRKASR